MAFCPQCGKQVADQATKCVSCGKEVEPKAKGARFKGTMMMVPGSAPQGVPPSTSGGGSAPKVPEPPKPFVVEHVPPRVPTAASSKVMKATMLGTGGAGLAPPGGTPRVDPPVPTAIPRGDTPTPGAISRVEPPIAAAPPRAAEPAVGSKVAERDAAPKPGAPVQKTQEPEPRDAEDSQRFLVGDPMAPHPSPRTGRRSNQGSIQNDVPVPPSVGKLVGIGVGGMLAIAAVGYFTARYMGLIN